MIILMQFFVLCFYKRVFPQAPHSSQVERIPALLIDFKEAKLLMQLCRSCADAEQWSGHPIHIVHPPAWLATP